MTYRFLLLVLLFVPAFLTAQFSVNIIAGHFPAIPENKRVFVAGNFNNWNPGDSSFCLQYKDGNYSLMIPSLKAGSYKFKFTLGNWQTVETDSGFSDIPDREFYVSGDTTLYCSIGSWKSVSDEPVHTASVQVTVMDTAFYMPQLGRKRKIAVYLPRQYAVSSKRYPVVYMQDGQNLFDAANSFNGEWGVDECLDSMSAANSCIVVAIDNGGVYRNCEYDPWDFMNDGKLICAGQGKQYADFLVKTLKPYIDRHYRTLASRENTIIAGSSMGALIAFYVSLAHPGVFGKAGIFSPSFWVASDSLKKVMESFTAKQASRYFFYMGGIEGKLHLELFNSFMQVIGGKNETMIYGITDPSGKHEEYYWRKWLPVFFRWILKHDFNDAGITEDQIL